MRKCLTVENIKHFVEHFVSFQGHWPIIHMPTFTLLEAWDGLVLAIICIGAIYSDRRDVYQVREMMEIVKDAVHRNSRVYNVAVGAGQAPDLETSKTDIEELQALFILQTAFIWHGNPQQRSTARQEYTLLASLVTHLGLLQPASQGHPAFSLLHQPGTITLSEVSSWDWSSWVEQEKRIRTMYFIFLMDTALTIYFNHPPLFDPFEVRLPLPSDDAVWDARSATDCANALGLNGLELQQSNVAGSRRTRQPDMRSAMRSLLEPEYTFQQRATNAYSKFILIHTLLAQIWRVQRANLHQSAGHGSGYPSSTPSTPLSSIDWVSRDGSHSGMPTDNFQVQNPQTQAALQSINQALQKWKGMWDYDIAVQYPPEILAQRRFGFSRDGIHFYYLAQSFLRSVKASEWTAPPDLRFMQAMTLLKKIKGFVVNDSQARGLTTGSVGDIDENYGVGDLTLDMKLLFKPYSNGFDDPVPGVQTHLL